MAVFPLKLLKFQLCVKKREATTRDVSDKPLTMNNKWAVKVKVHEQLTARNMLHKALSKIAEIKTCSETITKKEKALDKIWAGGYHPVNTDWGSVSPNYISNKLSFLKSRYVIL